MSLEILKKFNIRAKKSLGQNFLISYSILESIADTIEVGGQNIVEVGPGYGALTEKLIERNPRSLNLVELDKDMVEILEKRLKDGDFNISNINFHINNVDVLKYEPFPSGNKDETNRVTNSTNHDISYSVIANIPYYITSPILRHFLYDLKNKPKSMVILMQKDVGDKILSGQDFGINNNQNTIKTPLTRGGAGKADGFLNKKAKSSVLSLFVAKKCYVDEVMIVGKQNFIPAPKVESSVLLFETHDLFKDIDDDKFLDFIKKGFKEPRKMLVRNLLNSGYEKNFIMQIFDELGIENTIRGEDLNIVIWCDLFLKFNK